MPELENTPYQNIESNMKGLGAAPALENIDLAGDIPVAGNQDEVSREATRYLGFPGDILTPSQKRERLDLRSGGEYYGQNFKTLVRSKGLLRRCQMTPLEVGFDFMSDDMIGDDANLHVVTTVSHNDAARGSLQASPVGKLNGIKAYPGDEIKGILLPERNQNTAKGVVEFKQLAGVDFNEFKASGLQEFIFPEWSKIVAGAAALPIKMSELQRHFADRKQATQDASIKGILDVWLGACDNYVVWGRNYLKFSSQLVKLPAHQGFVHTYSELAEMLFDQLEVRREDMISTDRDIADIVARANSGNNVSGEDLKAVLNRFAENQELLTQVLLGQTPKVETVPVVKVEGLSVSQPVTVADGRSGKIVAKPFGRYKVEFEDGSTEMFDKEQVQ